MFRVSGYAISFALLSTVLPLYGYNIETHESIEVVTLFTIASLLRGYVVRRVFNHFSKVR